MSLAALLEQVARRMPNSPAVSGNGLNLSYAHLCNRMTAIASALRNEHHLQAGDRVLILMENQPRFFEILFGCWAAGLCAVPVNAKLHRKEVEFIAQNCGARFAFVSLALANLLNDCDLADLPSHRIVIADDTAKEYRRMLNSSPLAAMQLEPAALAWLFYTSGTTGRPKGAMLSHRNLLFMCQAYYADIDQIWPGDTQLHAAPLSHGAGMYSLPHILAGGHQIVLGSFQPEEVIACINHHSSVSMFAAPTMVNRLVNSRAAGSLRAENLKCLQYGGAPMYVADLELALAVFGPRLYQLFGQGESPMTITGLSKHLHLGGDLHSRHLRLGSAGYARSGVEVKIINEAGDFLPAGTDGEVVTRSDCVMMGYWNDKDATSAAINQGWLRTGDLGVMHADGLLTLRDRSKDLIISGGSNIYPREIEEVLLREPNILECAVIGCPDADWGEVPVAFIVLRAGMQVTSDQLDKLLLDNIARFKRPRAYHFVSELPKNNYGKILKTALRKNLLVSS